MREAFARLVRLRRPGTVDAVVRQDFQTLRLACDEEMTRMARASGSTKLDMGAQGRIGARRIRRPNAVVAMLWRNRSGRVQHAARRGRAGENGAIMHPEGLRQLELGVPGSSAGLQVQV